MASSVRQGLGVGAVLPVSLTIGGDLYPPALRPRDQAIFSLIWGVMAIVGPPLAGFLLAEVSWRAVFFVTVIPGATGGFLVWRHYQDPERARSLTRIDAFGAVLLMFAGVLFLLGMQADPMSAAPFWTVTRVATLGVALLLGLLFVRRSKRAAAPLISPELARSRVIRVGCALGLLSGVVYYATMTFLPNGRAGNPPNRAGPCRLDPRHGDRRLDSGHRHRL